VLVGGGADGFSLPLHPQRAATPHNTSTLVFTMCTPGEGVGIPHASSPIVAKPAFTSSSESRSQAGQCREPKFNGSFRRDSIATWIRMRTSQERAKKSRWLVGRFVGVRPLDCSKQAEACTPTKVHRLRARFLLHDLVVHSPSQRFRFDPLPPSIPDSDAQPPANWESCTAVSVLDRAVVSDFPDAVGRVRPNEVGCSSAGSCPAV
jgi:hypothetical protein